MSKSKYLGQLGQIVHRDLGDESGYHVPTARCGTILEEAARIVDGDREHDYGHPLDDFTRITGMLNSLFAHKLREPLVAEDWPLIMECVKCSRQVNRHGRDNLVDGAGYWRTLEKVVAERSRRA